MRRLENGELLLSVPEQASLNVMLFIARENLNMWADVIEARARRDEQVVKIRDGIDAFRRQAWSQGPSGFKPPVPRQRSGEVLQVDPGMNQGVT